MSEGKSYRVQWKRTGDSFSAWLVKRKSICGVGRSLQDALDDLSGEICDAYGDGEPQLSLYPLRPVIAMEAPWVAPTLCLVGGNGDVLIKGHGDGLFSGGWCERCKHPQGVRTKLPLTALRAGEGDVAWPWWTHGGDGIDYSPLLVSERFLRLLSRAERTACEWREIVMPPRCKTHYFECIPKRTVAPVAVRGWTVDGWRCPKCPNKHFGCTPAKAFMWNGDQVHDWFQRSTVTRRSGIVGTTVSLYSLIFPVDRATQLLDRKGSKGLLLSPLGLIPSSMLNANPRLPPLRRPLNAGVKESLLLSL